MSAADPRYVPVEQTLPHTLPAVTMKQAAAAARKIYRKFGAVSMGPVTQRNPIKFPTRYPRRCWAATKPTTGHRSGWGRMVHDIAHDIHRKRAPGLRPHHNLHARLEVQIAAYVVEAKLIEAVQPKPKATPAPDAKLAKIEAAIKRWTTKQKRATTALRKLERKRKALLKVIA
jgi:hypothetical protein